MRLLDRYLAAAVARVYVLVCLLLLGLFGFFDLAEQLEDVGKGRYDTAAAIGFVGYHLPRRLLDLTPYAVLLATVIALGGLAHHHELAVMRAAGVSPLRIGGSLLKVASALLLAMVIVELTLAPKLQQAAYQMRADALAGQAGGSGAQLWARWEGGVVRIGALRQQHIPADIDVYRFGPDQRLDHYIHADTADRLSPGRWQLRDVVRKPFGSDQPTEHLQTFDWTPVLSAAQLRILDRPAESLSPIDLIRYIQYLQAQHQSAERFRFALWQKLALPVTTLAMLLFALPTAFLSARGLNPGLRLLLGALIGLAVHLIDRLAINLGLLFDLNPAATALAPAAALILMALYWLRRAS